MTSIQKAFYERLMAFIAAIVAAIMRVFGIATGAVREAGASIARDARRVADVLLDAGEATGRVAGRIIAPPAMALDATARGVGGFLGALVPRRAPTPNEIAADIASGASVAPVTVAAEPVPSYPLGDLVTAHALARLDGNTAKLTSLAPLPAPVAAWIGAMSRAEMRAVVYTPARHIEGHVNGVATLRALAPMSRTPVAANANASIAERLAALEAPPPARPHVPLLTEVDMHRIRSEAALRAGRGESSFTGFSSDEEREIATAAALRYARAERRKERRGDASAFGMGY